MTPAFLQPVSHTFHLTLGRWNYVLYSCIRLTKRVALENVMSKLVSSAAVGFLSVTPLLGFEELI